MVTTPTSRWPSAWSSWPAGLGRLGLLAAVAFHLGLMLFGWGFWCWSVPMLAMLVALLRFDFGNGVRPRRDQRTEMRTG
jgi:hypothetical protein